MNDINVTEHLLKEIDKVREDAQFSTAMSVVFFVTGLVIAYGVLWILFLKIDKLVGGKWQSPPVLPHKKIKAPGFEKSSSSSDGGSKLHNL